MDAESWLKKNCNKDDWSNLEEGLNDALWTNNVIEYMDQYVLYKQLQNKSSNNKYTAPQAAPKSCPRCNDKNTFYSREDKLNGCLQCGNEWA